MEDGNAAASANAGRALSGIGDYLYRLQVQRPLLQAQTANMAATTAATTQATSQGKQLFDLTYPLKRKQVKFSSQFYGPDDSEAPAPAPAGSDFDPSFGATGLNPVGAPPPAVTQPNPQAAPLFGGAPRVKGYRQTMKMGADGTAEPAFEPYFEGLTPEQKQHLIDNPTAVSTLNSAWASPAKEFLTQHEAKVGEMQKNLASNSPTNYYLGAGEKPGVRQVAKGLDALVAGARDGNGNVDWSKISPTDAFSMIFSEGKVNDPNAVIRQQEFDNIAHQVGWLDTLKQTYDKVMSGKSVPPALLQNIYATVQKKASGAQTEFFKNLRSYEGEAKDYQVPLGRLVRDPDVLGEYDQWKQTEGGTKLGAAKPGVQVAAPGGPAPAPSAGARVLVRTAKERAALGPGTDYVDSNGVPGRVPGEAAGAPSSKSVPAVQPAPRVTRPTAQSVGDSWAKLEAVQKFANGVKLSTSEKALFSPEEWHQLVAPQLPN